MLTHMIQIPIITQPSCLHVFLYTQSINSKQQTPKLDNPQTKTEEDDNILTRERLKFIL